MFDRKRDILINVRLNGREYELQTYEGEYRNLMMLLNDKLYLDEFGECKGIGRCGTCAIILLNPSVELQVKDRNETTTLGKYDKLDDNYRLACQIYIDRSISGLALQIDY